MSLQRAANASAAQAAPVFCSCTCDGRCSCQRSSGVLQQTSPYKVSTQLQIVCIQAVELVSSSDVFESYTRSAEVPNCSGSQPSLQARRRQACSSHRSRTRRSLQLSTTVQAYRCHADCNAAADCRASAQRSWPATSRAAAQCPGRALQRAKRCAGSCSAAGACSIGCCARRCSHAGRDTAR